MEIAINLEMKTCTNSVTQRQLRYLHHHQVKYAYLAGEIVLSSQQYKLEKEAKFSYLPRGKGFEKQVKSIEEQGKKQVEAIEEKGEKQ